MVVIYTTMAIFGEYDSPSSAIGQQHVWIGRRIISGNLFEPDTRMLLPMRECRSYDLLLYGIYESDVMS